MSQFKFRLATLLRLREHVKEQKQLEIRSLHDSRRQTLAEMEDLQRGLTSGAAAAMKESIFTVLELRLRAEHEQSLSKQIALKRAALAALEEKIAEKRVELLDAMRAVKSLEQLRRRQEERHLRAQNAAEQKFGDEVAQRSYARSADRKKLPR